MFIELDVSNENDEFYKRTINVHKIDDFYPAEATTGNYNTILWLDEGGSAGKYFVKQSYEEVRTLLANVSLLVNE